MKHLRDEPIQTNLSFLNYSKIYSSEFKFLWYKWYLYRTNDFVNGRTRANNKRYNHQCRDMDVDTMLPGWQANTLTVGHWRANSCANKILQSLDSLYAPIAQYLYAGGDKVDWCRSSTVRIVANLYWKCIWLQIFSI